MHEVSAESAAAGGHRNQRSTADRDTPRLQGSGLVVLSPTLNLERDSDHSHSFSRNIGCRPNTWPKVTSALGACVLQDGSLHGAAWLAAWASNHNGELTGGSHIF